MDNYRPISKLCILSKILETLVNKQLTQYLNDYNILSSNQSGFRKGHSNTTATLKVLNDIVESLDNKQHVHVFLLTYQGLRYCGSQYIIR